MRRLVVFNVVGMIGFVVQLAVLAVLLRLGLHYLLATALAVEAAVLHNYIWHERWTWKDRPSTGAGRLIRLLHFHLLNGFVSLSGNIVVTWALVRNGMAPLVANAVAVALCAWVNYAGSDRLVFRSSLPSVAPAPRR